MKKTLILATTLMLFGTFAAQNAFAASNIREACRAEAADAGIEDKDELENYIAECMDMMRETQSEGSGDEGQETENPDDAGSSDEDLRSSRH